MDFFFYGTLRDRDVLARVIGRHPRAVRLEPASVEGFRALRRRGRSYPLLVAAPGERTEGAILSRARGAEARRLRRFEGRAYVLRRLAVHDGKGRSRACLAFLPAPGMVAATAGPWDFRTWERRHKAAYLTHVATGRPI